MRDDEFDQAYEEHAQGLFAFLAYRTGDHALAEDLLADTFERVLRSRRSFDPRRGSAKTWIYSIALNLLRDHIRRRDAERRALGRAAPRRDLSGDSPVATVEARDAVARAMARLTNAERDAIALRYGAELTVPEIAALTGESLTTAEGRVYRALGKLRQALS